MLHHSILLILSLLFAISMLYMLSKKINISYPILLVLAGLVIAVMPGMPLVELKPDMVFLIFLPPLLYAAAWNTSWKDFWAHRKPIGLLAIGLVVFTSIAIAFVAQALIPGLPLIYGFLLGGIISPPDAIAATSVLQQLKIPRKIVTILEGESLINDASSLIVFRFSLMAILTGSFSVGAAIGNFFVVAGMGVLVGIAVALLVYAAHKYLPTDPATDTALTLITPYIMYLIAETFHFSGVMAVVSGGLFLSNRSHEIFAYNSRLHNYSVWNVLVYLLNGLVFILIGLQLPSIVQGLERESLATALWYGVIISIVTIIIRIVWVFSETYLPRLLFLSIRKTEPRPPANAVFLIAWSGMRGVVSLAAALSIPLSLDNGEAFPYRNLLLIISFVVILFTLVIQGLSLPWLIKKLNIKDENEELEADVNLAIKLHLAEAVVDYLKQNYSAEIEAQSAYSIVLERYEQLAQNTYQRIVEGEMGQSAEVAHQYKQMLRELVQVKRKALHSLTAQELYSLEAIREKERALDLEEARLSQGGEPLYNI